MHDKLLRQINGDIADALTTHTRSSLAGRKTVLALLRDPVWLAGLSALLPIRERLTCRQVLEACAPLLDKVCPRQPEGGWLSFSYEYVRRLMYPEGGFAPDGELYADGAELYLAVLQTLLDQERAALPFDPLLDFQFLGEEELALFDLAGEYRRFLAAWRREYLYELMRLGMEVTPFRTLSHIAGVHYIAMTAARGLRAAGLDVDLSLISGAAAAHDLGKFGCRPGERVPYLHYYYTDQWLLSRKMEGISHIAANHSVWDLELESLSVESLLLIYADFRSKQDRAPDGSEITVLYPLDDSFQVILSKLDNVDQKKRRRYEFVYGRLHDFEDWMWISPDIPSPPARGRTPPSWIPRRRWRASSICRWSTICG